MPTPDKKSLHAPGVKGFLRFVPRRGALTSVVRGIVPENRPRIVPVVGLGFPPAEDELVVEDRAGGLMVGHHPEDAMPRGARRGDTSREN
jgi:hypothetical protein